MSVCLRELIDFCKLYENIFCYGAGHYGRIIRTFLRECGVKMEGFVVTQKPQKDISVLELPVYSITEVSQKYGMKSGMVVCASSKYLGEIRNTLNEYSIRNLFFVDSQLITEIESAIEYTHTYRMYNDIIVLCYHRVADIPLDTWKIAVNPDLFEQQIEYLKNNYNILRSDEDWGNRSGSKSVIITFDDGYEDIYINALPILQKHNVPATVFVTTGNIGTNNEFWWDELERVIYHSKKDSFSLLGRSYSVYSEEEKKKVCYELHPYLKEMDFSERDLVLKSLANILGCNEERDYCRSLNCCQLKALSESPLITIGGHTVTHSCLANESVDQQKWEIDYSKKEIERIIGKSITVFSYPFGQRCDFTKETVAIAEGNGYRKIFAAYSGLTNRDYYNGYIPRINIGQETDFDESIRLLKRFEILYGDKAI